jgi:predicted ArsR family transcriptional regulator
VSPTLPAEDGGWRELASILTSALASPEPAPARAAEVAGEAHGRALATGRPHTDAPTQVAEGLGRLGFESSARPTRAGARIDIRPCPFLDLARSHGEVVCGVHRGLIAGMLGTLDPSLALERLEPFVRPDRCVARVRRA